MDLSKWAAARGVVAGRLVNCYAWNDWILALLYRYILVLLFIVLASEATCTYSLVFTFSSIVIFYLMNLLRTDQRAMRLASLDCIPSISPPVVAPAVPKPLSQNLTLTPLILLVTLIQPVVTSPQSLVCLTKITEVPSR